MSDEDDKFIAKAEEICNAATPEPWDNALDVVPEGYALRATMNPEASLLSVDRDGMGIFDRKEDARFTAFARTALPHAIYRLKKSILRSTEGDATIEDLSQQNTESLEKIKDLKRYRLFCETWTSRLEEILERRGLTKEILGEIGPITPTDRVGFVRSKDFVARMQEKDDLIAEQKQKTRVACELFDAASVEIEQLREEVSSLRGRNSEIQTDNEYLTKAAQSHFDALLEQKRNYIAAVRDFDDLRKETDRLIKSYEEELERKKKAIKMALEDLRRWRDVDAIAILSSEDSK